jgi:hypothetical protein
MRRSDSRKLGRRAVRHDHRTIRLTSYVKEYPAPPSLRDWLSPLASNFGAMLNLEIGCCTISALGHAVQAWSANHGSEVTPPDADIMAAYRAVSGYDPTRPETDAGAVMLDVFNYWRTIGLGEHKIEAFVALDPRNRLEMEAAVNLFGGVFLGLDLPLAAQDQTVWDVAPAGRHGDTYTPGSWGGHAVYVPAYSRTGWSCVTWGQVKTATWEFGMTYASEAYAALGPEWARGEIVAPNGFLIDQLRADLAAITK